MSLERVRVVATGVVQGVGFRPHVYGVATRLGLTGHVSNNPSGVEIEIEGSPGALAEFVRQLNAQLPPLARVDSIDVQPIATKGDDHFAIVESETGQAGLTLVPPDVATCDDCLAEMADPSDRRYRYPFINCTNCGPRFTIIRDLPYDRASTTMASFGLCDRCHAEYVDPSDRRYHAQPVACPQCGPQLQFRQGDMTVAGTDAVVGAVQASFAQG
ncbi:MAG: carbamoyltransferase HypF, partial [Acidimicrobiales bacterium]|nr:carbamoyltransferase HypF [Acidimicrobiales bacterium]